MASPERRAVRSVGYHSEREVQYNRMALHGVPIMWPYHTVNEIHRAGECVTRTHVLPGMQAPLDDEPEAGADTTTDEDEP